MSVTSVTVFGGTGFLGRVIVQRLASIGVRVRIAARRPERFGHDEQPELLERIQVNITDESAVASAVQGVEAVINAVGLYLERGTETFDAVHIQGALNVARQAKQTGVRRLVHVSGIGASSTSPSRYVRARAEGERLVRTHFDTATIVRPSVLYGPGDTLLRSIDVITRAAPVFPLFGGGQTRIQPVYVADVADAVVNVLENPQTPGLVCELGGPRIYKYRELIQTVLDYRRRRRLLLPVPFLLWTIQAKLLAFLANPPITEDQVILMRDDNVVGEGVVTMRDLGVTVHALEAMLPVCLAPA